MKKYVAIVLVGLKEALAYRGHLFVWVLVGVMEISVFPFVLLAAYAHDPTIGGLTKNELITYYFFLPIITNLTISFSWDDIKNEIQDGRLSNWLVRPVHPMWQYFWGELGDKAVRTLLGVIPMALLYPFLREYIHMGQATLMLVLLPFVLATAVVLTFLIAAMIGIVAAWTTQIWWILNAWFVVSTFVAGFVAPYALYPAWVQTFLGYTPFPLLTQIPIGMLLGTIGIQAVLKGILIGIFWVGVLLALNRILWDRGLRRVESVGI